MDYLEQMQRELDELYRDQVETANEYEKRKRQTERAVRAAILVWVISLGRGPDGVLLKQPTLAQTKRLEKRMRRAVQPLAQTTVRPPNMPAPASAAGRALPKGNVFTDTARMAGKAAESMAKVGKVAASDLAKMSIKDLRNLARVSSGTIATQATSEALRKELRRLGHIAAGQQKKLRKFLESVKKMNLDSAGRLDVSRRAFFMAKDYKENVDKVVEAAKTLVKELSLRLSTGSIKFEEAKRAARRFRLPKTTFKTSTETHPWAAVRGVVMDTGRGWQEALKAAQSSAGLKPSAKVHYLVMAPSQVIKGLSPKGITRGLLYRSFTFAALMDLYAKQAGTRMQTSTPDTLGIHHLSKEIYVPVPGALLPEAEKWAKEQKEKLKDE